MQRCSEVLGRRLPVVALSKMLELYWLQQLIEFVKIHELAPPPVMCDLLHLLDHLFAFDLTKHLHRI